MTRKPWSFIAAPRHRGGALCAAAALLACVLWACGDDSGHPGGDGTAGPDSMAGTGSTAGTASAGTGGEAGAAGEAGTGGEGAAGSQAMAGGGSENAGAGAPPDAAELSFEDARMLIERYAAAHPGQDGDVNFKTAAQIAEDPDAQALIGLCGDDARPVIPLLAWEYGGSDHAFMNPESAALVYCVYTPVASNSEHWQYDPTSDNVTVDVWVLYPDDNPCKDETGADQVAACIGDNSNFEILVDIASLNDGHDAGLELSEASTDLMLLMPDGTRVMLWHDA